MIKYGIPNQIISTRIQLVTSVRHAQGVTLCQTTAHHIAVIKVKGSLHQLLTNGPVLTSNPTMAVHAPALHMCG